MIKLVIWDLDETLWSGTLAEGRVTTPLSHIAMIHRLVDRGIICSIASKNDCGRAKAELERLGLWDLFVFPQISYDSKAAMVRAILSGSQLRAANTLFVDDNVSNRKEVQYYLPEIRVEDPSILETLLDEPGLAGQDDRDHTRLKQYRGMEVRRIEISHYGSNEEFLHSAQIRVTIKKDGEIDADAARIVELAGRAHQLNYLKAGLDLDGIGRLKREKHCSLASVWASDRYGDHGLVGFYALDTQRHELKHFVFSCRILNLGIEQWVYAYLGYPDVTVVGPVSVNLTKASPPDWITLAHAERPMPTKEHGPFALSEGCRVLLKGGCDLQQVLHYLAAFSMDVTSELTFVSPEQNAVHWEDTTLAINTLRHGRETLLAAIRGLPFADPRMFDTMLFSDTYDCVVHSLLMDYTRPLYRHKATGVVVPFGAYYDLAGETIENAVQILRTARVNGASARFVEWFLDEFEHLGRISVDQFAENLRVIRACVKGPIAFINGAEVTVPQDPETGSVERHRLMNAALEEFVRGARNCAVVDIRRIVSSPNDLMDCIRHYKRVVYPRLTEEIVKAVSALTGREFKKAFSSSVWVHTGKAMLTESARPLDGMLRRCRNVLQGR